MHRILLIEDDYMLGQATTEGLRDTFIVDWFTTKDEALAAIATLTYDLYILDVVLPDGSGLDILNTLRTRKNTHPVLLLTARDRVEHRVHGLNAGADDYMIKPFDLDELTARCNALIRRASGIITNTICWHEIEYHPASHIVTKKGCTVSLSARELAVFDALMLNMGKIINKEQIEARIYNWHQHIESNTVEVHISALRRKLGKELIHTVRGLGYIIKQPT